MFAVDIWSLTGLSEIMTVIIGVSAAAGLIAAGWHFWEKRRSGPKSDRKLLHDIDKTLSGEVPSRLNPDPDPGLIKDVSAVRSDVATMKGDVATVKVDVAGARAEIEKVSSATRRVHSDHGQRLVRLELGQQQILKAIQPNGLTSDMPGDVLQHVLRQNEAIMQALGIDPAVYDPKVMQATTADMLADDAAERATHDVA